MTLLGLTTFSRIALSGKLYKHLGEMILKWTRLQENVILSEVIKSSFTKNSANECQVLISG